MAEVRKQPILTNGKFFYEHPDLGFRLQPSWRKSSSFLGHFGRAPSAGLPNSRMTPSAAPVTSRFPL